MQKLRVVSFGFSFLALGSVACAVPAPDEPTAAAEARVEGDGCDPAAGKARLEATFNRTLDCATDAVSAGLADKVKLAGKSVEDTKRIVSVIKQLAGKVKVTNLSTARAILCVRSVTDYTTGESAKAVIKAAAVGLTDAEIDELGTQLASSFSFGASEVFAALGAVEANPNIQNLGDFLAKFAGSLASLGEFLTTCGSVLADYGVVSLPSIASYASRFAQLGVATSVVKCGFAVVNNAIDVGTELACFAKDLERLEQQTARLKDMNDDRCAAFQSYVGNPALLPLLEASGNTSEARRNACYQVIHHWGSCVYDAHRQGLFGSKRLSCDECARVCTGYVNGAGDNAYLKPVLDGAYQATGANASEVQRLVHQASMTCGQDVQPDGLTPCVRFCRGQAADCP